MQTLYKVVIGLGGIFVLLILILFVVNTKFWIKKPDGPGVIGSKNIDIEYWGTKIPEEVMNELIAEYRKSNPNINIKYLRKSYPSTSEYRDYVASVLRNGTAPDIINVHASWLNYIGSRVSTTGDLFTEQQFRDEFYNVFKPSCYTQDNKIRCIPLTYDGLVLVYNKGMFQDAGLSTPVTWEDVRDAAIRLTKRDSRGQIDIGGIALGTSSNVQNASDILTLMLTQSDVKIPDSLDSEAASRSVNYYVNFAKSDRVWDDTMPESVIAFATEKAAMALVKTEQLSEIIRLNPTINIGVTRAPQLPLAGGTTTSKYISSNWVEVVSANSTKEEQRESWEFLKWLSESDQQLHLFQLMEEKAGIGIVYANKTIKDQQYNSPLLGAFARSADEGFSSSLASDSGNSELIGLVNDLINKSQGGAGYNYGELKIFKDAIVKTVQKGF